MSTKINRCPRKTRKARKFLVIFSCLSCFSWKKNETLWLTINQMAELFNVDKSGISRHLKNIFATEDLQRQTTVANFATVQNEGERSVERDPGLILKFVTRLVIDLNIYVLNPVSGKSKGLWLKNGTIQNFLTVRQEVTTAKPRGKNVHL